MESASFGIDRERLRIGSPSTDHTPGVERGNNGPTSGTICLASLPSDLKCLAILKACRVNHLRVRLVCG